MKIPPTPLASRSVRAALRRLRRGRRRRSSRPTTSPSSAGRTSRSAEFNDLARRAEGEHEVAGPDVPGGRLDPVRGAPARTSSTSSSSRPSSRSEAKKLGITVTPAEVDKQLAAASRRRSFGGSEKKYQAALKKQGFTDAQIRDNLQEKLLEQKLFKQDHEGRDGARQPEIDAYYAANLTQFQKPATRAVAGDPGRQEQGGARERRSTASSRAAPTSPRSRRSTRRIRARRTRAASSPRPRAATCPSSTRPSSTRSAKTGVLIKPVKTAQYGWFVIKPLGGDHAGETTPEKQADRARSARQLEQQKQQQLASDWMQKIAKSYCSGEDRLPERLPALARSLRGDQRAEPDDHVAKVAAWPSPTRSSSSRQLTERLRRDCPWDREQTERTIVPHTVEEAYEVADAALAGDDAKLLDELGDLLFQSYFLALLLSERGAGDLEAVARNVDREARSRAIRTSSATSRPPRPAVSARTGSGSRSSRRPARASSTTCPQTLPALLLARKVQRRAAAVGFDYPDVGGRARRPRRGAARAARRAAGRAGRRARARPRRRPPSSATSSSPA